MAMLSLLLACGPGDTHVGHWRGAIDTLPSGEILVTNTAQGVWDAPHEWTVAEELRIGRTSGDGPDLFGNVGSIEVDADGRIWVLDDEAREVRVFDHDGRHVRTFGREGSGPGEFRAPQAIHRSPSGTMWVPDPRNTRVSIFDTSGGYVDSRQMNGGYGTTRWPGGFDLAGNYYLPVLLADRSGDVTLVRVDSLGGALDTLAVPTDPRKRDAFTLKRNGALLALMNVPFAGHLEWRLAPSGNVWGLLTDEYRLQEFSPRGDTLRTVTREFEALPVTDAEMEEKRQELAGFIEAGGDVDWSKVPHTKPAVEHFFLDDEGNLWVAPVAAAADAGRLFHLFSGEGLFLGSVVLPFAVELAPLPLIRDSMLYGVVKDDQGVPYVVRARILKP